MFHGALLTRCRQSTSSRHLRGITIGNWAAAYATSYMAGILIQVGNTLLKNCPIAGGACSTQGFQDTLPTFWNQTASMLGRDLQSSCDAVIPLPNVLLSEPMSFAFAHTSSAQHAPGLKLWKNEMTIGNQWPIGKPLRCRSNEVLKLWGASGNEQTVVETSMKINEQWRIQRSNERVDQRINNPEKPKVLNWETPLNSGSTD